MEGVKISIGILNLKTIGLYWRTLSYLRPIQVYGRLINFLPKLKPSCSFTPAIRPQDENWQRYVCRNSSISDDFEFNFLGENGRLENIGWNGPTKSRLWRYNQHYFDDLNAENSESRYELHRHLMHDWISKNPPGCGVGWEPYPTSCRIINWIKWGMAGNELDTILISSLAMQGRWLSKRLEIHLLGNHLYTNAKALIFLGLFFCGKEAEAWLSKGLKTVKGEGSKQLLEDGGHFELSTMYHALALEDRLDLCNLFLCYRTTSPPSISSYWDLWRAEVKKMLRWSSIMNHPDGDLSFFNDATLKVAPKYEVLEGYARALGIVKNRFQSSDSHWLRNSGYVRLVNKEAVVILDLANIGPQYLPGHAHADTLSFEFSLYGKRVLVNSGISCYGVSAERLRQRGTGAHNTVVVANQDSSEVWSSFRVGRRARPLNPFVNFTTNEHKVECSHDGYSWLPGKPMHSRRWRLISNCLIIEDQIEGEASASQGRFHFHPSVRVEIDSLESRGIALLPGGRVLAFEVEVGRPSLGITTWHPQFGISIPNQCLLVELEKGRSAIQWKWN